MSIIPSNVARPPFTKRHEALLRLFSDCCCAIVGHIVRRSAIRSLHELDERALRDIGIDRSQIEAAVYGFITLPGQGRMR